MGFEGMDDAAVYKIRDDLAIIKTLDFFTPVVDDPYLFGAIAAANSLSDVYAMGGEPILAMNIVCFPNCLDYSVLTAILQGGLDKVEEAGAVLAGGHTVEDNEPKYGLSVLGQVHPQDLMTNSSAKPGDLLYLTKPIGTGILTTALKAEVVSQREVAQCIDYMAHLNDKASAAARKGGANACTDVTGFGLLGHLYEMASASKAAVNLYGSQIPVLPQARELAREGIIPAGMYRNREYLNDRVKLSEKVPEELADVLFDPQTSGGLLLAVPRHKQEVFEQMMGEAGEFFALIGDFMEGAGEIYVYHNIREKEYMPLSRREQR